jgi:hypothetical protein
MIIALAGRRIDAADASVPRFPLTNADMVRRRVRELFVAQGAKKLVCAAACGADLLALEVAGELGLRRRIVLPFEPGQFRRTSVVDRPGNWGEIFDRVLREVGPADIVVVPDRAADSEMYLMTNDVILDEARALAEAWEQILAVIVWEGTPRGVGDVTAAFAQSARQRALKLVTLLTRD